MRFFRDLHKLTLRAKINLLMTVLLLVGIPVLVAANAQDSVSAATTTVNLNPTADTYVKSEDSSTNFGTSTKLGIDGNPVHITYLKFDLSSLAGSTVTNAYLRMATDGNTSSAVQDLKEVTNTSWGETTMTYNNKPALGATIGSMNSNNQKNTWVNSSSLTTFIASRVGNVITIGISQSSSQGILYFSRESSNKPVLVVETMTGPTATPTLAPTNIPTPTPTGIIPTPTGLPSAAAPILCPACNFVSFVSVGNRLSGHDFTNAFFPASHFDSQNISNSNFTGVAFNQSLMTAANMTNSNFTNADFTGVDMTAATTTGATFTGATWSNTTCPDGTNSDSHSFTCVGHL
jgi:hypothetical protein